MRRSTPGDPNLHSRGLRQTACILAILMSAPGCQRSDSEQPAVAARPSEPEQPAVQRPAAMLYGLQLPPSFRITKSFNQTTHVTTTLSVADATRFFQQHLLAQHVEVDAQRTVFPRAYLKADPARRLLRLELKRERGSTVARVRDITPEPMTEGLSQAERWQQAGRNPDGSLQNPSQVF